jgi:26S proteasome regulatory subunit N2
MLVFIQFWYWFPMIHFLSLSLAPSAFIGVNINLRVPKGFEFKCNAKPSMFDYPAKLKGKETNNKGKTETVKLSTTVKAKARAAKKGQDKGEMELEDNSKKPAEEVEKKEEEEKKEEPSFHMLKNPSRVLEKQVGYLN